MSNNLDISGAVPFVGDAGNSTISFTAKKLKQKRKEVKRKYWLIVIGIVLVYSGFNSYLSLQSSIHIEDGLGSKVTTLTYVLQTLISLFLAPLILRLIGPRKALIVGDCFYAVYVIVNMFSNEVLLYVGAIVSSFSEAIFWSSCGVIMIYFAKRYHSYSTSKSESNCMMEFIGIFYGMYEFNQVIGSVIVTIVLNLVNFVEIIPANQNGTSNFSDSSLNSFASGDFGTTTYIHPIEDTTALKEINSFQYCGINDCQDEAQVQESLDQYVPTNQTTLYVLTGCFLLMMLLGLFFHVAFLPEMQFSEINSCASESKTNQVEASETNSLKKIALFSFETIKDMLTVLIKPYQFFILSPYTLYLGFNLGFILAEATRAYAACILGVNSIGICVILFASLATLNSMIIGKFLGQHGLVPLVVFQIIFDLCLYIFCLFWQPNSSSTWVVYVFFAFLGVSNSTSGIITSNLYTKSFYKTKEISYNLYCALFGAGFAIQYAISTLLCVREKIYILSAWILVFGTLLVIFERFLRHRLESKPSTQDDPEELS